MKVYRIYITSWTASFRFPNLISGFQPTLPVPPLSTINGLVSAALGYYYQVPLRNKIGFIFQTGGKAVDLETIYQMKNSLKGIKSNVIKREFLFDNHLWIYTQDQKVANAFNNPYFQLVLGRSSDLASVNEIVEIDVEQRQKLSRLKGTIVPFGEYVLAAAINALPVYFTNTIPRRNIGTKPYYLLESHYWQTQDLNATGIFDRKNEFFKKDNGIEIYWQE